MRILERLSMERLFSDFDQLEIKKQEAAKSAYIASFSKAQQDEVNRFIEALASYEEDNVFNPWRDYDPNYDASSLAPQIRQNNLRAYLLPRWKKVSYVVIAEAVGYQGGRFSGIAITCERMLLGFHPSIKQESICPIPLNRTSSTSSLAIEKPIQREKGFNEPTDTVVWKALLENDVDPYDCLLWNIFPFHPYKHGKPLSNRTPTDTELEVGWTYSKLLLDSIACSLKNDFGTKPQIFGVGQKAAQTLSRFGVEAIALRHPANGGANLYKQGFKDNLRR